MQFCFSVHIPITKRSLTVPVSILEACWARCLSAQAARHGAAAATIAVRVLGRVLRHRDVKGRVAGVDGVALRVHRWVTQVVIGHWCLCWDRK